MERRAVAFSRERYSFEDGDNQRVKNQQKVISAIIDKVTSSTTILTKYTSILNALDSCFQTNIEQPEVEKIIKDQLNSMPVMDNKEQFSNRNRRLCINILNGKSRTICYETR